MGIKKFYWLKLKEDFFRQKEIKKLRRIAGGDTYTIIYLKMQLLSLRNEGVIFYEGTEDSFEEQLSLEIDEDIDNVKITLAFLFSNNLIEEISENEFLLNKVNDCIGKEGSSAQRMRKLRKKEAQETIKTSHSDTLVTGSDKKVTTEIEKEIEIEIEKRDREKSTEIDSCSGGDSSFNIFKYAEQRNFILSPIQVQQLQEDINIYSLEEVKKALDIADNSGKRSYNYYHGILVKRRADGDKAKKSVNKLQALIKDAEEKGVEPF